MYWEIVDAAGETVWEDFTSEICILTILPVNQKGVTPV